MERQLLAQPLDKKKARKNERDTEGGDETTNHGNIAQGPHAPCPDTTIPDQKPQAVQSQQRGGEKEEGEVAATSPNNATNAPPTSDNGNIKINVESPSQQSILNLRRAQTSYRDLMQNCDKLFSCKSKLDWEIRFGPKNNTTEETIMEMKEECKSMVKKRKEIEEDKGPTQQRLERLWKAIMGIATISSKNDPDEWETHTPVPTVNEEEEEEEESEDETSD